jgi:hypothetical protein
MGSLWLTKLAILEAISLSYKSVKRKTILCVLAVILQMAKTLNLRGFSYIRLFAN